jgi:hypothetical protein
MKMKQPTTKLITDLTKDRHDYLLSFRGRITSGLKSPLAAERAAAVMLSMWLDRYRANFKSPRTSEQNNLVAQMADDLNSNTALTDAVEVLSLSDTFDLIVLVTSDIEKAYDNRSLMMENQRKEALDVRNQAYEALKRLMNALDMAVILDEENSEKYKGYWNEIGLILDKFNAKVQFRSTWHKYAAEKNNEQPVDNEVDGEMGDGAQGDTSRMTAEPKSTMVMRSKPYSVVRLDDSMDMDLQRMEREKEIEELESRNNAMMGSVINDDDVATTDADNTAQADDVETDSAETSETTTGNSGLTNDASKTSTKDSDTTGHEGATDSTID